MRGQGLAVSAGAGDGIPLRVSGGAGGFRERDSKAAWELGGCGGAKGEAEDS